MTLGERIGEIITENKLTQVHFAKTIGVSPNYINQLVNGKKKTVSETLAKLIGSLYGYSEHWILTGEGDKRSVPERTLLKTELLKKVEPMPEDEVLAMLAFANSLNDVKKVLR